MKKLIWFILGLAIVSLACKTLQPPSSPTAIQPSETTLATVTLAPTLTEVPLSIDTAAPSTRTPRPTPEPIVCNDDSCLDACLNRIYDALPEISYEPLTGVYSGDDIEMKLVYYDVQDGQLGEPDFLYVPNDFKAYQQDTVTQQDVWMYVSGLIPEEDSDWLIGFEIFSSSTYAAWVRPGGPNEDDRSQWILGVDITSAEEPVGLTYILVHEFGHLITLNTDQIPVSDYYYGWTQNPDFCKQFLSPDGCSSPDSYINAFYHQFWKKIFPEWVVDVSEPTVDTSEEFRALVEDFYEKHSEQFVRDYAATSIYEDLAESFMYFVLEPKPKGSSIIDKKIRFFYDFPELVEVRQQMIQNVCSYAQ